MKNEKEIKSILFDDFFNERELLELSEEEKIISTEEVKKILGCSKQNVAYLVKKGKLNPVKKLETKYYFFLKTEIEKYKEEKTRNEFRK